MTELAGALQSLVDRPASSPPPLSSVAARSRRIRARRHRRLGGVAVLLVAGVGLGIVATGDDDQRAVSVAMHGHDSQSAGYVATAPGGFEGRGAWRLSIVRADRTLTYSSDTGPSCGPTGTIRPGDRVVGEISGEHSLLRAGDGVSC